ncbi:hypothetical protein B0H13DRAFT_2408007, partial [Mycena leptocephala]
MNGPQFTRASGGGASWDGGRTSGPARCSGFGFGVALVVIVEVDAERHAGKEADVGLWKLGVKEDEEACKVDVDAVAVEMKGGKYNDDTANGGGPDTSDQYTRARSPSSLSTSPLMSISASTSIPISSRFSYAVPGWTGGNHFHLADAACARAPAPARVRHLLLLPRSRASSLDPSPFLSPPRSAQTVHARTPSPHNPPASLLRPEQRAGQTSPSLDEVDVKDAAERGQDVSELRDGVALRRG